MALQYVNIERGATCLWHRGIWTVVAHTAVLLVFQLGQPRIFFSRARDGLLRQSFARVHPKFERLMSRRFGPAWSWESAPCSRASTRWSISPTSARCSRHAGCVGIWFCASATLTGQTLQDPWVPVLPVSAYFVRLLDGGVAVVTWIRFGLWLAAGLVIYFAYGRRRSTLGKQAL